MGDILKICPEVSELSTVNTNHKCPIDDCNTVLKSESNLNMHYIKHHLKASLHKKDVPKDTLIQYHCPEATCIYNISSNKFFSYKRLLKQHYLKVHAEKKFYCAKCSKGFSTNTIKSSHEKVCGNTYTCPDCKWEYKSSEALLTHCRRKNHRKTLDEDVANKYTSSIRNFKEDKIIILNVMPIITKVTQNKEVQTDWDSTYQKVSKCPTRSRKRHTQQTQTSIYKSKKLKNSVETQTIKNSILEKATPNVNIYTKQDDILESRANQKTESNLELHANMNKIKKVTSQTTQQDTSQKKLDTEYEDSLENADIFEPYYSKSKPDIANSIENVLVDNMLSETILHQNNLCSIETQTERFESSLRESTDSTFTQTVDISLDQLLYSNTHTQTCDDILLSELGFNDSHTQTYWPEYEDLVSTETQTTLTDYFFGDRSTQTNKTIPTNLLDHSEHTQTYFNTSHGS